MASDDTERDRVLRALLVHRVEQPVAARGMRLQPERLRMGVVTAVVLVAIVAVSVLAVRFGSGRGGPADGGAPSPATSTQDALPTPTIPAGKPLGTFTSDDGTVQTHTVHPDGLAIATYFICTGGTIHEDLTIHIPNDSDVSGNCGGTGGTVGSKGMPGSVAITIRSTKDMRWTLTVVGIPETYVTPKPIPTPTDSAGTAVPYCTAADLTARFERHAQPDGVTEANGGQLVFTNTTASTCALAGYPEVRFLDGSTPLGTKTMNHTDARFSEKEGLRAVILGPSGKAFSQVDWYLPGANAKEEGACKTLTVTSVQVDLAYDLSSPGQSGTIDVPIGTVTACLNGAHGALGKYGQLSSTVFVDYSLSGK